MTVAFDDHGWASGDNVTVFRRPGPETLKQQALAPGLANVHGVVFHYTDTRGCGAANLAKRLLDTGNPREASWHACVDATGAITQSVSAKCGSWHAGGPSAKRFSLVNGEWALAATGHSANDLFFGIELENAGQLKFVKETWCSWPFAFGTQYGAPIVVPDDEVVTEAIDADGARGWHKFTDAQVASATALLASLVAAYGLSRAACSWTHAIIDPDRRVDPGPIWTGTHLPRVLDAVFGA